MAWNELSFPFGSTLTTSQMNTMFENFDAVVTADSGAPVFQSEAFADETLRNNNFSCSVVSTGHMYLAAGEIWYPSHGLYAGRSNIVGFAQAARDMFYVDSYSNSATGPIDHCLGSGLTRWRNASSTDTVSFVYAKK